MAAISFERYYSIYNPKQANKITFKLMLKLVMACFLASLFWSTMPLLGWSNYMLEDGATGCCIETREKSLNVQSYNLAMFVFVFMIPFGFIIVLNICFFLTVGHRIILINLLFLIFFL
jgi:c-opsin